MSGAASPSPYSATETTVRQGYLTNPTGRRLGLPLLEPALAYNKQMGEMLMGASKQDPRALSKFYGMPGASTDELIQAMQTQGSAAQGAVPGMKQAATGGIMSLSGLPQGYAPGGVTKPTVKDLTDAQKKVVMTFNTAITEGKTPTAAQIAQINKIEQATGRNVSPYTNSGTAAVGAPELQDAIAVANSLGNYPKVVGTSPAASITTKYPNNDAALKIENNPTEDQKKIAEAMRNQGLTAADAYNVPTYGTERVVDPVTGKTTLNFTDPNFNKAMGELSNLSSGTGLYGGALTQGREAISGLMGKADYSPQQVAAQNAAAASASAQQGSAQQASSQGYSATNMSAPEAAKVQDYTAAQADVNQMKQPKDVTTEATKEQQMTGPAAVQAKALQNFQMQGPGSWTDEGVSQKYMDPYKQGVIDIAKREKGKDYQNQLNALNSKAISAGAFGGGRQAMERSQASKDYQQQLQDLETQGMSQAYQSGMGQYGAESGLSQQANIQNLQAMLGVQQTGSAQELQAALANQGMDYNTAMPNLQARMGTQQFNANQNLQGQLANQQAGLTTGQANLGAAQQTSLANQAALNLQRQQYVQNALQAEMQRYGGQLTAAQQNSVAQNAASQFTAAAGNQASLQNASLGTQASLTNAQLGTNAALQNAAMATQTNQFNQNLGLQAGMANQQAGLSANSMGIGALGQAGNLGLGYGNFGMGVAEGYGKGAQYTTSLGQQEADRRAENAKNLLGGGTDWMAKGLNLVSQASGGSASSGLQQTSK